MAKIEWVFQDESGTNLNRYIATNVNTGEKITFDLLRGGNISIVGTPLNASNLNSLITAINANYDEIATLKTSVSTNATNIQNNTKNISTNKSSIDTLNTEITNAKSRISNNEINISNNTTNISKNASDISQLQTDVANQGQAINDNKSSITSLNNRVIDLESDINENSSNIETLQENFNDVNADIADINNRLENLGFKTGVFTVSAEDGFGSLNPSDLNITLNSIRKKGKYCIGNFRIEQRTESKYYGSIKTLTLIIPEDFKPSVGLGFYAKASIIQNTLDGKIVPPIDDTIWVTSTLNNTKTINIKAQVTDTSLYKDPSIESVMFLSIGWETA